MKKLEKNRFIFCFICLIMSACIEEDDNFPQAASLKIVHAAAGAPSVYINYLGIDDPNFSVNPALSFGDYERLTLPANELQTIRFTYTTDTTSEVYRESIILNTGQISTFFLLGDSVNLSSAIIDDVGHQTLRDSLNAIRFVNMSQDIGEIHIALKDSSEIISADLSFSEMTQFIEFDATLKNPTYNYTFMNDEDSVIASYEFRQYNVIDFPGFFFVSTLALQKNVTLALIGRVNDGQGNGTLSVVQINNF